MKTGDIVIISFPFTNLTEAKARPAVVVAITNDAYKDVVVCMITSIVPNNINKQQLLLRPSSINNLRSESLIKVARISTVEQNKIIATIGRLDVQEMDAFVNAFKSLVD